MGKKDRLRKERLHQKVGPDRPIPRSRLKSTNRSGEVDLGSDIRQPGPVDGYCALCLQRTNLRLSHILPKWAYKTLKDEGAVITHRQPEGTKYRSQDGTKHYLLCADCEQYLGEGERYLKDVSTGTPEKLEQLGIRLRSLGRHTFALHGIDAALIRRALLGMAVKVHHAPSYRTRIKNPDRLNDLRRRVAHDDYSHISQPVGMKWMEDIPGINPMGHTMAQLQMNRRGGIDFHTKLGGIEWFAQLGDNKNHVGPWEFLDRPPIKVMVGDISGSFLLFPDASEDDDHKPPACCSARETDRCPCGSSRTFAVCCSGVWCDQ